MEPISSIISVLFLSITISLFVVLVSASHKSRAKTKDRRRPPGPRGLPFIGSIHHLLTSQPHAALRDLALKHGPVMYLRLGQVDAVVVSSPAAAREVLRDSDADFASRPRLIGGEIICYGRLDIAMAPYGAYWRALRKLATLELLSPRKVRQLAPVRDAETLSLVGDLRAAAVGETVNLSGMLISCANSIIAIATFGDRFGAEIKEEFLSAMAVVVGNGSGLCVSDLFPSLWFVDVVTGMRGRLQRAHAQLDVVTDKIIADSDARREERRRMKMKNGEGEDSKDGEDLLSVMLRIRDKGEYDKIPIGTTNIKAIIIDLFLGGTETTSSIAEWVMSELVRNPEVMVKAQAEVREVFNKKNTCDHESLLDQLHYMRMVIKETMRLYPPLPLLLPRLCIETCDVGGFKVAKGTRVIVNSWAMARSPEYWEDAEVFRPERFEKSMIDYKGTQFEYMPFGSGRRMCPGMAFGMVTLELIVARLLYYFDWSLPVGMRPEELDMDMTVGAATRRVKQLQLVATPCAETMEI
ncbi:unnamed protein product [Urochloa humidicola]